MKRMMDAVAKIDDTEVKEWLIYEQEGHGVVESPAREGRVIKGFTGTEFEVYMACQTIDHERYGTMSRRSSWESPVAKYKLMPR